MILAGTALATVLGGLTGILPGVIDLFNTRAKFKNAERMLELKLLNAKATAQLQIDIADANEGNSLRDHDSTLGGKGFVNGLRATIRPFITYGFFGLFLFVKIATAYVFYTAVDGDIMSSTVAWNDFVPLIWTNEDQAIFGAVIGFWFGGRIIEKLSKK